MLRSSLKELQIDGLPTSLRRKVVVVFVAVLPPTVLQVGNDLLQPFVLIQDQPHFELKLFVVCGEAVHLGLERGVVVVQTLVLLEDDLLAADAHVTGALGGLVVLQTPSPVTIVLKE